MNQQRIMQPLMSPDIVIIHDNAGYHLLHGHLHLAMAIALSDTGKVAVDVRGYGTVQVAKTNGGLAVQTDGRQQPLLVY